MENITEFIRQFNGIVSGPILLPLLAGAGLFLTIGLRLTTLRRIPYAFRMLWDGRKKTDQTGDISPFNALMTAMSATVGTGNIAGVATAIFFGGPGALFWMWLVALLGMGTAFAEASLAVRFREKGSLGNMIGGPMYYIRKGLGEKWKWLAFSFALFGMTAGFGIGNTVQSNSVADALNHSFGIHPVITGIVTAILVGLVLLGGIRRIGDVAGKLVPIMATAYIASGLVILGLYWQEIPSAIMTIVESAFTPVSAAGGFAGATVWGAIRFGIARGIFSNEAGMGSSPIAHATATTDSPARQGTIAMLGVFLDTIVICSMTGLVIVVTGAWQSGKNGAAMSAVAFESALPQFGQYVVSIGLVLFAFTTLIGWSFYSEKCTQYLFGVKAIKPFRLIWVLLIPVGTLPNIELGSLWLVADTLNALMAIPNLIGLFLLSPVVFKIARDYWKKVDATKKEEKFKKEAEPIQ